MTDEERARRGVVKKMNSKRNTVEGANLSLLINYINSQRKKRRWSIRELSERAGISHTGLSRILAGESVPTVGTIEKLADAFGVDRFYMLELLVGNMPEPDISPSVTYLAERLSESEFREELLGAFRMVLDIVDRFKADKGSVKE